MPPSTKEPHRPALTATGTLVHPGQKTNLIRQAWWIQGGCVGWSDHFLGPQAHIQVINQARLEQGTDQAGEQFCHDLDAMSRGTW